MTSNLKLLLATLGLAMIAGLVIAGCKDEVVESDAERSQRLSDEVRDTAKDAGEPDRPPGEPDTDLMGM